MTETDTDRRKLADNHAEAMFNVLSLSKNASKGHWGGLHPYDLLQLARAELREFEAALWGITHGRVTLEQLESEAADVSNFLAMIVDNYRMLNKSP